MYREMLQDSTNADSDPANAPHVVLPAETSTLETADLESKQTSPAFPEKIAATG